MSDYTHDQGEGDPDLGLAATRSESLDAAYDGSVETLRPGDCVGRYTIRELLGVGGMGQVYAALDPALGRAVALKLIHPARLGKSQGRARFLREAQALARLSHPNVVTVFDVGTTGEQAFVAMELVEGQTLDAWLGERRRTWREVRDTFVAAGRGLQAAHAAGLVHRDFKPLNVMVASGRVVVLDFGLARAEGEECAPDDTSPALSAQTLSVSVTLTGELLGTPGYMAPEQLGRGAATARSDQFSFCAALFEALYGRLPFAGRSAPERAAACALGPEVPPGAHVPRFLAAAVARGLRADPDARFGSMAELLRELARDPARTGRRWLASGVAVASLVAATGLLVRAPARPSCERAAEALHERWQPARREALAAAFAALPGTVGTEAWRLTEPVLDRWAGRWEEQRVEVCESEAGGQRPTALTTSRRDCLDRRLVELDSLLGALAAPDRTVARYAASAAHGLTAPESCLAATPREAPLPPAALAAVGRARARIDTATSLRRLGKPRQGLGVALAAALEADQIAWPPFVAEAQLEVGAGQLALRAREPAGEAYRRALLGAEAAGDDALRFEATLGLERVDVEASEFVRAGYGLKAAAAIDQRLPADPRRRREVALLAARLASMQGQFRECLRRGEEAVVLAQEERGLESLELAAALMAVGECHVRLGEEALGRDILARALAITEKTTGHDQLETASLLSDIASLERHAGLLDDSLRDTREVLAIRERLLGPDGPDCAAARNNLANVLVDLRRYGEAREQVDRALEIWTKAWGPTAPAIAVGLSTRAGIAKSEGHPELAEPDYRRALEIRRAKRGDAHPETVRAKERLAEVLEAQGKREALALYEEALAAVEKDQEGDAARLPKLRFELARARSELGADRGDGAARVASACKELESASGVADALAACRAWVAGHPHGS